MKRVFVSKKPRPPFVVKKEKAADFLLQQPDPQRRLERKRLVAKFRESNKNS